MEVNEDDDGDDGDNGLPIESVRGNFCFAAFEALDFGQNKTIILIVELYTKQEYRILFILLIVLNYCG